MCYSNETRLMCLSYRERKLMAKETQNFNLLRKIRRKMRALKNA